MKWQKKSLDELGNVSRGKSKHRPRDAEHLYGGAYPFIQTGDVKQSNLYITKYSQTYSEEGLAQSKLWKAGTLCITVAANIADTSILAIDACFPDSIIGFTADPDKADTRFVKYLFDALLQKRYQNFTQGSAQDNLSQAKLLSIKFPVPLVETQQKIADILSKYDDLIENNRRRIELLERSARLLYKEWFVRLRFPGHEHTPIIDGIPEGWERLKLSDVCQTIGGGTPSTNKPEYWNDGDIIWVVPTDVTRNNCLFLVDSEKKITESGLKNSSAKIVPPETILMTSRASVGFFALMEKEVCTNQGFINIIPSEDYCQMYILHNLIHRVEEIRSNAGGATYREISKSRFRNLNILIPSKPVLLQFQDYAYKNFQQVKVLQKQNQKLKQARDILLPKLMNGEIEV